MVTERLIVDPELSKLKFERELQQFQAVEAEYWQRGLWLIKAQFPTVFAVFVAAQLRPPSVVFGAVIDFSNYDIWPPSVALVNPFNRQPYLAKEVPTRLKRKAPGLPPQAAQLAAMGISVLAEQPLVIDYGPDTVPFVCLAGIREYHDHPAHSGDSWYLHRGTGVGTLHFILEQLHRYGVQYLNGYQIGLQITGMNLRELPE